MESMEDRTFGLPAFLGHTEQMLHTHPNRSRIEQPNLIACIRACFDCAQACVSCADACLSEPDPRQMLRCIRLNEDCAEVCETTGKILSRQTASDQKLVRALLVACALACKHCGDECALHGDQMPHCAVCADACRACEAACDELLFSA